MGAICVDDIYIAILGWTCTAVYVSGDLHKRQEEVDQVFSFHFLL